MAEIKQDTDKTALTCSPIHVDSKVIVDGSSVVLLDHNPLAERRGGLGRHVPSLSLSIQHAASTPESQQLAKDFKARVAELVREFWEAEQRKKELPADDRVSA